jgi:hypothetical protein
MGAVAVTKVVKRLDDGRVVSEYGEIWRQNAKHPMRLEAIEVCPRCKQDVMSARTVLGGSMKLDADGHGHDCRSREIRAWHR